MARKSTLKVNKMIEPPKPPALPLYRYEVAIFFKDDSGTSPGVDIVDVFAQKAIPDDDALFFYIYDQDETEEMVASFKDWSYFIRKESEADLAALKWGKGFEALKKTFEEEDLSK